MTRLLQNEHHLLGEVGGFVDRLEVLEGPTGRRSWPDDVKARIVMESLEPGVRICDVARRNGLAPQHLSSWRGLARKGKLALPAPVNEGPAFAALELEDLPDPVPVHPIEIEVGGITVRLAGDASAERVAEIASALRAAR
jgi:transposase